MSYETKVVASHRGELISPEWLALAEGVHRQLRPHLERDYVAQMGRVIAGGGAMVVAVSGQDVAAVAVYRIRENTFDGLHMYVDDLVTDEGRRSTGAGAVLMAWLQNEARKHGCERLKLDSGTQRASAHRFYFREGMQIASFHFHKDLDHE